MNAAHARIYTPRKPDLTFRTFWKAWYGQDMSRDGLHHLTARRLRIIRPMHYWTPLEEMIKRFKVQDWKPRGDELKKLKKMVRGQQSLRYQQHSITAL